MKKIIPFKKEIIFNTNIDEITSISLEHQLSIDKQDITGNFIVSGEYKISDSSITVESFEYNIPFEIMLDECYDTSNSSVEIDDFYYEIENDKILSIHIDVCIDKIKEIIVHNEIPNLEEKTDIIEELYEEQNNNITNDKEILNNNNEETIISQKDQRCIEENDKLPGKEEIYKMEDKIKEDIKTDKKENDNKINSIFNNIDNANFYVSYNVYILREGDTVDSIIEKYSTSEEELKKYNNLTDLKIGDKIIIPSK